MYGSGVRTGTGIIHLSMLPTQLGLHRVRTECRAAVVGSDTPRTAGQPFAIGSSLVTVRTFWVFGLLFPQVSEPGGALAAFNIP